MQNKFKIIKYLVGCFYISLLNYAQSGLSLSIENQEVISNEFYFDLYFKAPNDNIFVGNAILLLEFNHTAFSNPNIYKDPFISEVGGNCDFIPISSDNEDIIQTRSKYYNNSSISILGNEIEILVSIDPPIDIDEFNSSIARIDDQLYRLGSFKLDGLVDPNSIELRWKETCPTCLSYSEVHTIDQIDFSESNAIVTTIDPNPLVIEPGVKLSVRAFLEGSYDNSNMSNNLMANLPLINPYQTSLWNHLSSESIESNIILDNDNIVDWVLVELRTTSEASSLISQRAALINREGITVDLDGSSPVSFPEVNPGLYYIILHHRNHLSIMSSNPVFLSN